MKTTLITIVLAFALLLLAAIGMGIGKLLTGKNKLNCKRCGNPEKTEKKSCELCQNTKCKKKR